MRALVIYFLLWSCFALAACSTQPSFLPEGAPAATIKGYRTTCHGKLYILANESRLTRSQSLAGEIDVQVLYESEPTPSEIYPTPGFLCSTTSKHTVRFIGKEDHEYRLKAANSGNGVYSISAYEILEIGSPESQEISTTSEQNWGRMKCRYYPPGYSCL